MDEFLRMTLLLDIYGELLTPKQREFMALYYSEDLSLSEVADIRGITPQGARDIIRRTERLLSRYEEKLNLLREHTRLKEELSGILRYIQDCGGITGDEKPKLVRMLEELVSKD